MYTYIYMHTHIYIDIGSHCTNKKFDTCAVSTIIQFILLLYPPYEVRTGDTMV